MEKTKKTNMMRMWAMVAVALGLAAGSAPAVTEVWHGSLAEMTMLDGSAPTNNFSGETSASLVLNPDLGENEGRVVFRVPEELGYMDPQVLARAQGIWHVFKVRNVDGRAMWIHPLTNAYEVGEVTWAERAAGVPWATRGGDFMTNCVEAVFDGEESLSVDLLPLLSDPEAAANLLAYGAVLRLDNTTAPAAFTKFWLDKPESEEFPPDVCAVILDEFDDVNDFAVSYIDSRDSDVVFWEQDRSTVGKILLNGSDESECRAVLSMPETLAALPAEKVQSVVAKFDAEVAFYNGTPIHLYPLSVPTALERRRWEEYPSDETPPIPSHGPTWNAADAPASDGAASSNLAWTAGGDWAEEYRVTAVVDTNTVPATATFDLTPLWKNPEARAMLVNHGAIAVMDPAGWAWARETGNMPRVNLYRPDPYVREMRGKYSWMRVTEYAALATGEARFELPMLAQIDGADTNSTFFGNTAKIVVNAPDSNGVRKASSRAVMRFPEAIFDLDPLAMASVCAELPARYNQTTHVMPLYLDPLNESFGTTALNPPSWMDAFSGDASVAWTELGAGNVATNLRLTATYDGAAVRFDLTAALQDTNFTALARANGARLMADESFTGMVERASHAMYSLQQSGKAVVATHLAVAATHIDQGAPNEICYNGGTAKTVRNGDDTECRALMKFAPSLLEVDGHAVGQVNLFLTRKGRASDLSANPVVLSPLAVPFRLGEATWTHATRDVAWTSPGGDFLPASVEGTFSADGSVFVFDLAPLLADATAGAALENNGAVLRITGEQPSTSLMANCGGGADTALHPLVLAVPAELETQGFTMAADGTLTLDVGGLNPLHVYELWSRATMDEGEEWSYVQDIPADGLCVFAPDAADACRFFRIQEKAAE